MDKYIEEKHRADNIINPLTQKSSQLAKNAKKKAGWSTTKTKAQVTKDN